MSRHATDLKAEVQKSLALMRTLRDEIRVQIHLGGMDVKDEWRKLELEISDVERAAADFSEATRTALAEKIKRLSKLRSSLK